VQQERAQRVQPQPAAQPQQERQEQRAQPASVRPAERPSAPQPQERAQPASELRALPQRELPASAREHWAQPQPAQAPQALQFQQAFAQRVPRAEPQRLAHSQQVPLLPVPQAQDHPTETALPNNFSARS